MENWINKSYYEQLSNILRILHMRIRNTMFVTRSPASYTLSYFNSFKKGKNVCGQDFQNYLPAYSQTYIKYASCCASIDNTYQNTKNLTPTLEFLKSSWGVDWGLHLEKTWTSLKDVAKTFQTFGGAKNEKVVWLIYDTSWSSVHTSEDFIFRYLETKINSSSKILFSNLLLSPSDNSVVRTQ